MTDHELLNEWLRKELEWQATSLRFHAAEVELLQQGLDAQRRKFAKWLANRPA